MKSLRTRFFLLSWPLVLVAIASVAFSVDRWTVVELERIDSGPASTRNFARDSAWVASIAPRWSSFVAAGNVELARLAGSSEQHEALVALDSSGILVAKSDSTVTLLGAPSEVAGVARLRRSAVVSGRETSEIIAVTGIPVRDNNGRSLGALYILPLSPTPEAPSGAVLRAAMRRRIWAVAIAAGLASAAAAFILAGPLVARVRRLADAAAAIRDGALDTRVDDKGGDELAVLGQSFNAMAQSLAHARQHQRNLVSDVAHELRTPLSNVIGLVEALQDGLYPVDSRTLATLHAEVQLLGVLVHELQELSLAETGQIALDLTTVDAVSASRDAIAAIRASAGERQLVVSAPPSRVFVRADAQRLAQVLRNLLRNAVTHTNERGSIEVGITSSGDHVTITVTDDGRGIPPEHLQLVFERFHRVDASRDRASGGMGLGLAVVRHLVAAMGGRVWVESEEGKGARFFVEMAASGEATTRKRFPP